MYPIQMQAGNRGIGMGYGDFVSQFVRICEDHLHQGRARSFAFIFYDMKNGVVRRALRESEGFRQLHESSGNEITLFYLHDSAVKSHKASFNAKFMAALGVDEQVELPAIVFFRVGGGSIEDVSFRLIDAQCVDPVLVVAELVQYVEEAKKNMRSEGNISPLLDAGKAVIKTTGILEFGTLVAWLERAAKSF